MSNILFQHRTSLPVIILDSLLSSVSILPSNAAFAKIVVVLWNAAWPDRSVFIEYLLKRLKDNHENYLDTQKLYISFKEAVINNSPNGQTSLYGAINEAGD